MLESMPLLMKPLIVAIVSLSIFSVAPRSLADVVVPIDQALVQIEGTQVPILIPSVVPNVRETYVRGRGTIEGYSLDFSFTPTCDGTACNYAWMTAERGGAFFNPDELGPRDTIASVKLAKGIQGQFANTCGAYCLAQVAWQSQGVLYRAVVKNGQKDVVLALANSAILGGERRNAATRPVAQNDAARKCQRLTRAWLTSEDRSTPINVRDGASTDSYARHLGYAGDEVAVLNQKLGGGYCWYEVRFPSQATGWVRGDFLTIDTGE
ncbi:SH3 domain-containing protein [Phormidesmis priestleyi]|uniref:SH3 domain-containing protein n=1 Tax=Phormidesmis priestleyi TaxID=268141 RepID=UPI0012E82EE1|nr:SH3 domain-containing protein [Phormidesmis priestleyi]